MANRINRQNRTIRTNTSQTTSTNRTKSSPLTAVIVAVLLIIVSIVNVITTKDKEKHCTLAVTAEITNVDMKKVKKSSNNNRNSYKTEYKPYFTYVVDGVKYTGNADTVSSSSTYKKGDKIAIKVDPNKPEKYLVVSGKSSSKSGFVTILCAIVLVIAAFIPKKQTY